MKRVAIGIILAVIVIGVFLLALTNPNLRENKEMWFGFIHVDSDQNTPIQEQKESIFTSSPTPKVTCDPSYPDVCIFPWPPDLDCEEIEFRNFKVIQPDKHGFDRDNDGIGCES